MYFSCKITLLYLIWYKITRNKTISPFHNPEPGILQHQFNVGVDLRKLGLATEFGLQVANEFSEKKLPQYELNLHINKDSEKVHLHVYNQPEDGSKYN